MGANLTKHSTILIFPWILLFFCIPLVILSFPILIPSSDSAFLDNKPPPIIKNAPGGWGSLGTGSLLWEAAPALGGRTEDELGLLGPGCFPATPLPGQGPEPVASHRFLLACASWFLSIRRGRSGGGALIIFRKKSRVVL